MAEMWDYIPYSMNAPFGRTRVTLGWNLVEPDSTALLVLFDHTFSNLSGMERECARTVRSSSKVCNPTFQPLIGSQEPTPEVLVPVINFPPAGVPREILVSRKTPGFCADAIRIVY